tara:strand:+ start:216 stop:623 length:408 start_codon:yes stop_codon:yes gene_type:complete
MAEIELEDLIQNLFENEPQPIKSINVVFEDSDLKKLFESLLMIFTHGMKKHFGNSSGQVDLTKLTEDNIIFFNRYMNSFGIQLVIEIEQYSILIGSDYDKLKYTNLEITNNTKLNELKLPFLSKGLVYIISFDFI